MEYTGISNMIFRIEKPLPNELKIVFFEALDVERVAKIWSDCNTAVLKQRPQSLFLDFSQVDYCDGAGIALIRELHKAQSRHSGNCDIRGLKPDFWKLLDYINRQHDQVTTALTSHVGFPERVGQITVDLFRTLRDNIIFLGTTAYQIFFSLLQPRKIRWVDFFRITEDTGPQAVPIVALIGFLIGLISTFQAAPSFADFGAQIYMVNLVGLGLVREMGPLLTAVLLAGRTASAFAAEIGTMKINQELDALQTMGLSCIRFLVVPRVLATMLITPILEVFFIIFGLLGCLVVMHTLGYTVDAFFHQMYQSIEPIDYIGGLIKVTVFGLVIAGIGCLHGIKTCFGAQAVGYSTTQAVVSNLIMLVVVDGIFAVIYYALGI